jgi:Major capsid protein Gp23
MANLVQNLLNESAQNAQQAQFTVAQRLAKKWAKSGLLEGLQDYDRANMAIILESQAKQLIVESSQTNGNVSAANGATFTPGNGEQWAGVALPLVRKIFGQIAAKEFVSVQPMNLPAGLVFYLDFQYGGANGVANPFGFTNGTSVYGQQTANFGNAASGALYGAGTFNYSLNAFSASVSASAIASGSAVPFSAINFDATYSASLSAGQIFTVTIPNASITLPNINYNGVRAFELTSGSAITVSTTLNQFTKYTGLPAQGGTDILTFVVTGSLTAAQANQITGSATTTLYYNKMTDFNARGDFEDRTSTQGLSVPNAYSPSQIYIPEVNVQMKSQTISAKTRKLKAQWTPEFAQDLNAYHSLDAEAELTGLLSEYISLEIDLEILDMLIQNAPTVLQWSAKIGNQIDPTNTFFQSNTAGAYYNQMTWFQTIGIKLQKVSNLIHQRTLRGGANFMVVSPAVATILESIPGFAADTDGAADTMKYAFGVQKIGSLNSRYKVYKNPYMLENFILLGFRGNQFLECGAVYSPYVPLIMTPLIYDPTTFTPRKGIMTRYAMTMIRPEFYGGVQVADLNIV